MTGHADLGIPTIQKQIVECEAEERASKTDLIYSLHAEEIGNVVSDPNGES